MLQAIGGIFFIATAFFTWRQLRATTTQVEISRESQVTDSFTKAIEQLGNVNPDVRTGAVYALERIANSAHLNSETVYYILAAFIRGRLPWPPRQDYEYDKDSPLDLPGLELRTRSPDVQAAITVLGRRTIVSQQERKMSILELANADLRRMWIWAGNFLYTNFRNSNLGGSDLREANFGSGGFRNTILRYCYLPNADFSYAKFWDADLSHSDLESSSFRHAILSRVNLSN